MDGLDGLRDAPRSGRPPKVGSSLQLRIRRRLEEGGRGWRVKEVWELIKEGSDVTLSVRQVYRLLHAWGYRPVVPRRRFVRAASGEEREALREGCGGSRGACPRASP